MHFGDGVAYPSRHGNATPHSLPPDVSDDEWAFLATYLTLMRADAPQRHQDVHALIWLGEGRSARPSAVIHDSRTLQSTPKSGLRTDRSFPIDSHQFAGPEHEIVTITHSGRYSWRSGGSPEG